MLEVKPSFEIVDMPTGDQALSLIERMGRIAYKSEDKIDPGLRKPCMECFGQGEVGSKPDICSVCAGRGSLISREPSSHAFVRMILKAEKQAKLALMLEQAQAQQMLCSDLAKKVYEYMRANPAHESVIEHCKATVVFTTNRGATHELVRHRLSSITQESTRYCDYNKGKFGKNITVIARTNWGNVQRDDNPEEEQFAEIRRVWEHTIQECEKGYLRLRQLGVPAQIARDLLPHATKADIGMTANFREWRLVFAQRASANAHPDVQQLMYPLQEEFRKRIPIIFDEGI